MRSDGWASQSERKTTACAEVASWVMPGLLIASMFYFISQNAIDTPRHDDWRLLEVVSGLKPFSAEWVWELSSEHRQVIPKVFLYVWGQATGWNLYYAAFWPGLLIAIGGIVFLRQLPVRCGELGGAYKVLLRGALACWLFTLTQAENLLWGFQLNYALLFLLLIVFEGAWREFLRSGQGVLLLAVLLGSLALTLGHGVIVSVYVVGFVVLQVLRRIPITRAQLVLAVWAVVLIGLYLYNYVTPAHHKDPVFVLSQPKNAAMFALYYLGNSLVPLLAKAAPENAVVAAVYGIAFFAGGVILMVTCGLAVVLHAKVRGRDMIYDLYQNHPLIPIGIAIMLVIMTGRLGWGPKYAVTSRFVTMSVLLGVGTWLYSVESLRQYAAETLGTLRAAVATRYVLMAIFVLGVFSWSHSVAYGMSYARKLQETVAPYRECALAWADDKEIVRCVCQREVDLFESAGFSDQETELTLLEATRVLRNARLSFFNVSRSEGRGAALERGRTWRLETQVMADDAYSSILYINWMPLQGHPVVLKRGANVVIEGRAWDVTRGEPASGVYVRVDDKWYAATYGLYRPETRDGSVQRGGKCSGFRAKIPRSEVSPGRHVVSLFVVAGNGQAYYSAGEAVEVRIE